MSGSVLSRAGSGSQRESRLTLDGGRRRSYARTLAVLLFAATAFWPPQRDAVAETVAGVTAGALSVESSGAASYAVPIAVPPGVAGMEPGLSLIYNSRADNGILGIGWSLGGLSIIHRCPQTLVQDGVKGGINFDAEDRFCLDGQRLVAVSGAYGADGTEYRTEIDSFSRVVSHGTAGSGPAYFTVETKAGQILEYGGTTDSRVPVAGRDEARFWALNRVEDTVGNYMTLAYLEDAANETCRLDRIDYAGNTTAGTLPQSAVQFLYEVRPDTRDAYQAGARINMMHRLTGIQTSTDAALVHDYRFAYDESPRTGRSRLLSVTECDAAGDCLQPTAFGWTEAAPGWVSNSNYIPPYDTGKDATRFVDVDGDGLVDVVWKDGTTSEGAHINTGDGWSSDPNYIPPYDTKTDATRFVDVNGDGLVDVLWKDGSTSEGAHINTGNGWVSDPNFIPPHNTKNSIVRFAELNGDGLPDLLWKEGSSSGARINNGAGWDDAPEYAPPYGTSGITARIQDLNGDGLADFTYWFRNTGGSDTYGTRLNTGSGWEVASEYNVWATNYPGTHIVDVNGDGLLDYFYWFQESGSDPRAVKLNTGTGWITAPYIPDLATSKAGTRVEDMNGDGLPDLIINQQQNGTDPRYAFLNTGNGWDSESAYIPPTKTDRTRTRIHDVNGDGLVDFVWKSGSASGARLNTGAVELLVTITDSLGQVTTIDYAPLTDDGVYTKGTGAVFPEIDLQGPLYVVKEVAADDGLGGQAQTTYSYEGARGHLQGRGFLGFARMAAVDQQTGIETVTDYLQDFPFIGRVATTETRLADGTMVKRLADTWDERTLNGGLTHFPFVSQSQAEAFEINDGPGNLPVTTTTSTTLYDDFGNPTSITASTTGGGETFVTTSDNSYANDTVNWLLGRLARSTVTNELPDLTSATRVTAFDYDAASGLLIQEVIEPDLAAFTLTTDYGHDAFGNLITETVSGADITTRTTTTEFSTDGRFAIKVTNDLGHAEDRDFDARFGTVTSLTGPNGITTSWDFDGFGRMIREARADGTETVVSYDLCVTQCPAGGVYAVVRQDLNSASQTPIGPRSAEYFDALNRGFRGETEGFDGTKVLGDTEFNARGEVVAVTRPYFEGTAEADKQKVLSTYDVIGRTLTVTQPDGGLTSTDYAGLTTTSTNALDQVETRRSNAIGDLVEATDNLGTAITYAYDPFGNLLETNAGGVVTAMAYDIRGRKTSMDDPDMGFWTYDYNVLSELISQTDAKTQSVELFYDTLGRLERRVEPEGTTEWFYDSAAKGIGKLHSVTAPDGYLETQSYDGLGRPSATTTTIDGVNYTSSVTYDAAGRVETQTYPSGFAVRNTYNTRGYLASVSEDGGPTVFWEADAVNAEGQVTLETLGNGVTTARAFDPRTGLIDGIVTDLAGSVIQDLTYDFDLLGNLRQRADLRQSRQEDFLYDGLNRLTSTSLVDTSAGGGTLATTAYTYDSLGNIQTKSDVGSYTYDSARPHAVTAAGGETYGYDDNGNMISGAGRDITYASFNKPTLIREIATGDEAGFTYGPDRARIKQHIVEGGVSREVVYLGAYERRTRFGSPDELVHYITAGGTVAIHTVFDDDLPATNKARYLHRDHLGSIESITGETGAVVERLSFDSHGKRRLADWTAGDPASPDAETPRGFTAHEHLDSVGLIHMNGRVYDPTLGRFLSADPFVPDPTATQAFNRYSYVGNNPLSYTDPSGFFFKKIKKFFKNAGKAISKAFNAVDDAVKSAAEAFFSLPDPFGIRDFFLTNSIGQMIGMALASYFGPWGAAFFAGLVTLRAGGGLMDTLMAAGTAYAIGDALGQFSEGLSAGMGGSQGGGGEIGFKVLAAAAHGAAFASQSAFKEEAESSGNRRSPRQTQMASGGFSKTSSGLQLAQASNEPPTGVLSDQQNYPDHELSGTRAQDLYSDHVVDRTQLAKDPRGGQHACEAGFYVCVMNGERLFDKGYVDEANFLYRECRLTLKMCYNNEDLTQTTPAIREMWTSFPPEKSRNGGGSVHHSKGQRPVYVPPFTDPIGELPPKNRP